MTPRYDLGHPMGHMHRQIYYISECPGSRAGKVEEETVQRKSAERRSTFLGINTQQLDGRW